MTCKQIPSHCIAILTVSFAVACDGAAPLPEAPTIPRELAEAGQPKPESSVDRAPDAGKQDSDAGLAVWLPSPMSAPYALVGSGEDELYMQSESQLLRSVDRAESFHPVTIDGAKTLTPTLCPNGIRLGLARGALYHSQDGVRWTYADTTALWSGESFPTTDIACDDRGKVYATRPSYRSGAEHTLAVSSDRGMTWARSKTWMADPGIPAGVIWNDNRELRVVMLDARICTIESSPTCSPGLPSGRVRRVHRLPTGNYLTASDETGTASSLYRIEEGRLEKLFHVADNLGAIRESESALLRYVRTASEEPGQVDWSSAGTEWMMLLAEPNIYAAWITPQGRAFVAAERGLWRR